MFPEIPDYKVGDVIAYEAFGGLERLVLVQHREADVKNGLSGFDGIVVGGSEREGLEVWGYDDQIKRVVRTGRAAVVKGQAEKVETIARYMPSNYTATVDGDDVLITGYDNAGWTLEDYVIPRLASGLWFAEEVVR